MSLTAGKRFVDQFKIVWATEPKNWTGAASTSDIVSFKNYGHFTILIQTGAWAGGTAAVTILQGTSVGTAATALSFTKMYTNATDTTSDLLVETAVVSNTFTLGTANAIYVIEVDEDDLTVASDMDCLKLAIASPSTNADIYGAIIIGSKARYGGGVSKLPSAIID